MSNVNVSKKHTEATPQKKRTKKMKRHPFQLIRWKIIGAFAGIIILLCAMLSLTYRNLEQLKDELNTFNEVTLKTQMDMNKLSGNLAQLSSIHKNYIISGNSTDLSNYESQKETFEDNLAALQKTFQTSHTYTKYLETIVAYYETYANTAEQISTIRKTDGFEAAQKTISLGIGEKSMDKVNQQIDYTTTHMNKTSSDKLRKIEKSTTLTEYIFFLLTVAAILFLTIAGSYLFRSIRRNTKKLMKRSLRWLVVVVI
ncbi:CHASE3 domain-containing protein [Kurthia senegalensis]|uniref:CHASE3 domain-containing protein n=1 Tax=Kurthia senegalensis TaxID=1033740 RepID=UPI0002DE52D0|nr:CHASE3 domain-containing protein [Kurthia senegalensis]